MCHNYWAFTPWACAPQQQKPLQREACPQKLQRPPLTTIRENLRSHIDPAQPKINKVKKKFFFKRLMRGLQATSSPMCGLAGSVARVYLGVSSSSRRWVTKPVQLCKRMGCVSVSIPSKRRAILSFLHKTPTEAEWVRGIGFSGNTGYCSANSSPSSLSTMNILPFHF